MEGRNVNGIDWIDKQIRKPAKTDEDAHGCILAWHRYTGVMVTNADNFNTYGAYMTHWAHSPEAPKGGAL